MGGCWIGPLDERVCVCLCHRRKLDVQLADSTLCSAEGVCACLSHTETDARGVELDFLPACSWSGSHLRCWISCDHIMWTRPLGMNLFIRAPLHAEETTELAHHNLMAQFSCVTQNPQLAGCQAVSSGWVRERQTEQVICLSLLWSLLMSCLVS